MLPPTWFLKYVLSNIANFNIAKFPSQLSTLNGNDITKADM